MTEKCPMTPNAIEILLHCHVCPLPHPEDMTFDEEERPQ